MRFLMETDIALMVQSVSLHAACFGYNPYKAKEFPVSLPFSYRFFPDEGNGYQGDVRVRHI